MSLGAAGKSACATNPGPHSAPRLQPRVASFVCIRMDSWHEPLPRKPRHLVQRPRFFKEMRGSRYDRQPLFAAKLCERGLVQPDDLEVIPAYDQQCRRPNIC